MPIEKNKWVEDALSIVDNISRAAAPDMAARVLLRAHKERINKEDSAKAIWRMAASVALLIGLNVGSLLVYNSYYHTVRSPQNVSFIFGVNEHHETDPGSVFFGN